MMDRSECVTGRRDPLESVRFRRRGLVGRHLPTSGVRDRVMEAAEARKIVEVGRSPVVPTVDVMQVGRRRWRSATREHTAAVAQERRPPLVGSGKALRSPNVQRSACFVGFDQPIDGIAHQLCQAIAVSEPAGRPGRSESHVVFSHDQVDVRSRRSSRTTARHNRTLADPKKGLALKSSDRIAGLLRQCAEPMHILGYDLIWTLVRFPKSIRAEMAISQQLFCLPVPATAVRSHGRQRAALATPPRLVG